MAEGDLVLKWKVLSAIGPNWIGGDREMWLTDRGEAMAETAFVLIFFSFVADRLGIPAEGDMHVIEGEATLKLVGENCVIEFQTEANIPYDWEVIEDEGVVTFSWSEWESWAESHER